MALPRVEWWSRFPANLDCRFATSEWERRPQTCSRSILKNLWIPCSLELCLNRELYSGGNLILRRSPPPRFDDSSRNSVGGGSGTGIAGRPVCLPDGSPPPGAERQEWSGRCRTRGRGRLLRGGRVEPALSVAFKI